MSVTTHEHRSSSSSLSLPDARRTAISTRTGGLFAVVTAGGGRPFAALDSRRARGHGEGAGA
ncbi:hypothetical protein AB0M95_26825 [Sphaerisporangium sp. NPDC051017]|uniref:hypothetical protein n=1 Tax=Sphaerisporangium sp. NPDC051017 TaxID=3154636 RepID=UPI0034436451